MNKNHKNIKLTAMAAIMVVVIAAILTFALRSGDYLVLRNGDTDEEFARFRVSEGDEFSVTFIHSVNHDSIWKDCSMLRLFLDVRNPMDTTFWWEKIAKKISKHTKRL